MKKLLHLELHRVVERTSVADRIGQQWVEGFQLNAERINDKRKLRVPDEKSYQDNVVGVSVKLFKKFLNPDFISRAGLNAEQIINKHIDKLEKSYNKYNERLNRAYGTVDGVPAKIFKDAVAASKKHFMEGMSRLLPFTGTRAEGLGIAPLVVLWLTDDNVAAGLLTPSDKIVAGSPILVCKISIRSNFKSAVNPRLVQAGLAIVASKFDPKIINDQNDITNELIQGFVNPGLDLYPFETGGKSHADYVCKAGSKEFYLDLLVTQK